MCPNTLRKCSTKGSVDLEKCVHQCTFNKFGQEVSRSLGFLNAVSLHDLPIPVDSEVPRSPRLGLSVQDGRVGDVVVFEHTLFKLTLGSEVFLKDKHIQKKNKHMDQVKEGE